LSTAFCQPWPAGCGDSVQSAATLSHLCCSHWVLLPPSSSLVPSSSTNSSTARVRLFSRPLLQQPFNSNGRYDGVVVACVGSCTSSQQQSPVLVIALRAAAAPPAGTHKHSTSHLWKGVRKPNTLGNSSRDQQVRCRLPPATITATEHPAQDTARRDSGKACIRLPPEPAWPACCIGTAQVP
jgi:hypothetical protein